MAIFTNQATLSYRNNVVTSNVVTGQILEALSATKNSLLDTYAAGDTVTYIISILNSGAVAMTDVDVSDNLGRYQFGNTTLVPLTYVQDSLAYYVNGVLQARPEVTAGPYLEINDLSIPAGGNAMLIYQATVNEFAPLGEGGVITNTATITSAGETIVASETIRAECGPMLTITKGLTPSTVTGNGQLTYTLTIQNFGNTDAVADDDLIVTDTFDPILNDITVVYNGETLSEGEDYTYDEATGKFATVAGRITVPAATYSQDGETGEWVVNPGVSVLTITGNI